MASLYKQKIQTLQNVINHVDNGRVPIISMAQTWAIPYGGGTAEECKADPHRECEIYGKHLQDMYFDGVFIYGLNRPLNAYNGLGYEPYFISPDGVTLQCDSDLSILRDDEIEAFIKDPVAFLREVALPRRYPALQNDSEETVELLKNSMKALMEFVGRPKIRNKYLKNHCQTPAMCAALPTSPALDQYILYRGLVKGLGDLRRRPEQVLAACEAMLPMVSPAGGKHKPYPWLMNPIVSATYLSTKQFKKFFWPTYKKMCDQYIADGGKICSALEGKWGAKAEFYNEFPANSFIVFIEDDDYFEIASKIGDKVAVSYPFPQHLLRNGTVEEVKTEAMRIIDKIGTKGTFFSVDKCLLSSSDARPENLAALCEVSRDYHP